MKNILTLSDKEFNRFLSNSLSIGIEDGEFRYDFKFKLLTKKHGIKTYEISIELMEIYSLYVNACVVFNKDHMNFTEFKKDIFENTVINIIKKDNISYCTFKYLSI